MFKGLVLRQAHWIKRLKLLCVGLIVLLAIGITCVRLLTPLANQHKPDLEHQLTLLLGEPVTIHSMQTSWYWFQPVLKLNDVRVYTHQHAVITLRQLLVGVNLVSSLWHWQIQPGILFIDDAQVTLQQSKTGWRIEGIRSATGMSAVTSDAVLPVMRWLLLQQKIVIKNISASIRLQDGTLIPVETLTVHAVHRNGRFRVKGHATIGHGDTPTQLTLLADLSFAADRLMTIAGPVYIALQHVEFAPWRALFVGWPYRVERGQGDLQLWLTLRGGQVHAAQASLAIHAARWQKRDATQSQRIDSLSANLAWKPTRSGWEWSADQVKLTTAQKQWPTNQLLLSYNRATDDYRLFVKTWVLDQALMHWFDWPDALVTVFQLQPSGQLENTQFGFNAGRMNYFLSRFAHLSWHATNTIPAVTDLSGACYWEPHAGRLELDSEDTLIAVPTYQPLRLHTLNLALDWRAHRKGWRINLQRLFIEHPHAIISGRGQLTDASWPAWGKLRLAAEFSAQHAEFWSNYLPNAYLKPKLLAWLKQDIKRIQQLNGHVVLDGALADFPFDKQPGTFKLVTSLHGVDLLFHPDWPLVQDMQGTLSVDKRALRADIRQADLGQALIASQVTLNLSDIGLGHEQLLVNGRIDALGEQMLHYIQVSPLKQRLHQLSTLSIQKPLGLDLALTVPLYPEDDPIVLHGAVHFAENTLTVKHALTPLDINQVSGELWFDEHGVKPSKLQAEFADNPLNLTIRSVQQPHPATEIQVTGDFSLASLQMRWPSPLFAVLQGHLPIQGLLLLAEEAIHADTFHFDSTLQGVSVALPAPFGKDRDERLPSRLDVSLHATQGIDLNASYGDSLRAQLRFAGSAQAFALQQGLICVDCTAATTTQDTSGVRVMANLAQVDWSQWQKAWVSLANAAGDTTADPFAAVHVVDLKLADLAFFGEHLPHVHLHAVKSPQATWSIHLKQRNVLADLNYQTNTNTLIGHVSHLTLPNPRQIGQNKPIRSAIKPEQIPHLNLTCDRFTWNKSSFGPIVLKSTSSKNKWHLDELSIKSPPYALQFSGEWTQDAGKDYTQLQSNLYVTNVAKFLALWSIPPVVEASYGEMEFRGGWPGDPRDFSLSRLTGDLDLIVKNGRITHLDAATEKKLGVGKLLSILSLQTIPRRLKLDFSDLSKTGYTFDRFQGQFVLKNGLMSTDNSSIDGPVADATMKGSLDLTRQLYDLTLHVSPHVTASLPVIVTLAGGPIAGPIAGLATWVVSKVIINQGVDKVTGYTYTISGPWLEPVVQQAKIYRD